MANTSAKVFGHGRPTMGPGGPILPPNPSGIPIEARHLGQTSQYSTQYDPSLLVSIPRQENRDLIGLKNSSLPFVGCDVWNAYECSCLTEAGLPISFILKLKYSSSSEFIVESKSIKLYLNSFNMTQLGENPKDCIDMVRVKIQNDLSDCVGSIVRIQTFDPDNPSFTNALPGNSLDRLLDHYAPDELALRYTEHPEVLRLEEYSEEDLEEFKDKALDMPEDQLAGIPTSKLMSEAFDIPQPVNNGPVTRKLGECENSNLLRSNCKVTHQPDWGSVCIFYKADKKVNRESLLKYIISFRNENHFHEEICETIYARLHELLEPEDLLVACFYTRRGGIDINPIRATSEQLIIDLFGSYVDPQQISNKTSRQ
jgi:7-cyano-7-deazaguanine reductase